MPDKELKITPQASFDLSKIKIFDSFSLKLIAALFMLCDHAWATVFLNLSFLTRIGRIAFPIFAYGIAEGFFHTKSRKKYALRMFIFALISEIPFNLMQSASVFYPFDQNVMFTFLIALGCMSVIDWFRTTKPLYFSIPMALIMTALGYAGGTVLMVDYHGEGVLLVLFFYFAHLGHLSAEIHSENKLLHSLFTVMAYLTQLLGLYYFNTLIAGEYFTITIWGRSFDIFYQQFALLALLFIWLSNGKKGYSAKWTRYFFYVFYPAHILILSLIAIL